MLRFPIVTMAFLTVFVCNAYAQQSEITLKDQELVKAHNDSPPLTFSNDDMSFSLINIVMAYGKQQTDYHTPLDTDTTLTRRGANNRSSQIARSQAGVIALFQFDKQQTGSIDWYRWIAVSGFAMDTNDPDHPDLGPGENQQARFEQLDTWIRYSPILPLGITIGSQSIKATSNAKTTFHYRGDYDSDFIMYSSTGLHQVPGISLDFHLTKKIEFGLGRFQGMSDLSRVSSLGEYEEAQTSAAWFRLQVWKLSLSTAFQAIRVGGEDTSTDPANTHDRHRYDHRVFNTALKVDLGRFHPYIGLQSVRGDKVQTIINNDSGLITLSQVLNLGLEEESEEFEVALTSIGLVIKIWKGEFAIDHTKVETPEFNEKGSTPVAIGLDSAIQTNYMVPIKENAQVFFFYNQLNSKDDSNRKEAEARIRNSSQFIDGAAGDGTAVAVAEGLESLEWTNSQSVGVGFRMMFGNLDIAK